MMTNEELLERYPFLRPRNRWTGELMNQDEKEDEELWTELDDMPIGWRIAFGEQMCEELLEILKEANPDIEIWAVEPENAAILAGGTISSHIQMGIGDGLIPPVLNCNIFEDVCIISDEEALETSKDLAKEFGTIEKLTACNIEQLVNSEYYVKSGFAVYDITLEKDFDSPFDYNVNLY